MSVQPEEFLAQGPSAFLNQPTFLEQGLQPLTAPKVEKHPDFAKIAVGIAAALVVLRIMVKHEMAKEHPRSQEEIDAAAKRIYKKVFPAWLHASLPAIKQAYQLGATSSVSYAELEEMATVYATELGDYVHDSSILALTDAFNAQVNAGWSERLAWQRAQEAYGLDAQQMRSYVKGLMARDKSEYVTDPVPAAARSAVDRAFLYRADRLGTNEAFKATQVGRNMVWLSLQASGGIPAGTLKRWVTAEDERVCVVCGPLHMVEIPLHRRFESNGQHFYAPGVHPNCRCELELVYPEQEFDVVVKAMPGDPFNRNSDGEFARKEGRSLVQRSLVKKPLVQGKPLVSDKNLVQGKPLVESKSVVQPKSLVQTKPLVEAKSLLSQETKAKDEAALAALVKPKVKLKAKEAAKPQAKVATRTRKKTLTRDLRPDDPQRHATTMYVPADAFLKVNRDIGPLIPGMPIDFGKKHPTLGVPGLLGFHQVHDAPPEHSPAFDKAFEAWMDFEGGGNETYGRLKVARENRVGNELSTWAQFGDNQDLAGFDTERQLLANRSKAELLDVITRAMRDQGGYFAASDNLRDVDAIADATANDLADEVMWTLKSEADLYEEQFARTGLHRGSPWHESVAALGVVRSDDDIELDAKLSNVSGDGSIRDTVEPVFFRIPGWYGVSEGVPDSIRARSGIAEGKYTIESVRRYQVPPSVNDSVVQEIMDHVTVVYLKFDKNPEG